MNAPTKRGALVLALACALPLTGGCVWTPELRQIKQDIAHQIPGASFDQEVSFSIGPGGMALARAAVALVPAAHDARVWLKDVSRVEVALYEVSAGEPASRVATPARIEEMLEDGWEMAARVREPHESVWILYRVDGDSVREMFVVSLDRQELVMVKVKGRLERLIARALTEADGRSHWGRLHERS